ncbi:MAG: tRNA preQ1(34) S-adenosylmethionine ribosyltransferase-isomerase QueA [Candidatus Aureabacteria bacterium]|nr:tRNA preQ1(34) S-adenosylmethionine ribosyltransferase-isomerase QueA [Candidatus Auribacterota bacterium]
MRKIEFEYNLPERLIAQKPASPRSSSKLMVMEKGTVMEILSFKDIGKVFRDGDLLVLNNTEVLPCKIIASKYPSGARIEVLLVKELSGGCWQAMARPLKRLKKGTVLSVRDSATMRVEEIKDGFVVLSFPDISPELIMKSYGLMPLPPYINRKESNLNDKDKGDYQTVFAKVKGAVAAPTAGLHFTQGLLKELDEKGVEFAEITLHVGLGTFLPVEEDKIEEHRMHSESFFISEEAAEKINRALREKRRIISVGTTVVRALEASYSGGKVQAGDTETDIFIYPGYSFKIVKNMITNFHLPCSTLLMLVCALAGRENIMKAYKKAVDENMRFYSYGDAMFIVG